LTAQTLHGVVHCFRIGDPNGEYPIFDPTGSRLIPGRWNTSASPMIYTSEHFSTALLEKLVQTANVVPPNQHFIKITVPNGVTYEEMNPAHLPHWADQNQKSSRQFGAKWHKECRSLLLFVPSIVAREDFNILINPEHPEFLKLTHSRAKPVWWDGRLFAA
jgi:RES domain-containing protein